MHQFTDKTLRKLLIALSIYITSLVAANLMGFKVMPFFFDSHISVGIFMFPFVFLTTDVIGELYGKRVAKFFVLAGIISTLLWILYNVISIAMPWAESGLWVKESYETMLGVSLRIAVASVVAFAIAEYQDVLSFFFFKAKFGQKMFWLRSTLSNLWSQFLDTVIFMMIAFYGVYDNDTLISLIITWWLFKVTVGFFYTPLSYLALRLLRDTDAQPTKS